MCCALAQDSLVPLSTDWVPALLLTIVWIVVAAAVAGPVVRYLRGQRRG